MIRDRRKTLWITLVVLVSIILPMFGCTKMDELKEDMRLNDIGSRLGNDFNLDSYKEEEEGRLKELYDIGKDEVEEFKLYTNEKGEEILMLKAKDEKDLEDLKNKVEARKDKEIEKLKDTDEERVATIKNSMLSSNGKYLIHSISNEGEKIKNSFEGMFNK